MRENKQKTQILTNEKHKRSKEIQYAITLSKSKVKYRDLRQYFKKPPAITA